MHGWSWGIQFDNVLPPLSLKLLTQ